MNLCDVCSVIVAPARTGKTYYCTEWIAKTLIPDTKKKIFTNLPLRLDNLAEYCHKKYRIPKESVFQRVHLIDRKTETNWKNEGKVYFYPEGASTLRPPVLPPDYVSAPFAGSGWVSAAAPSPVVPDGASLLDSEGAGAVADERDEHIRKVLTQEQARLLKPDSGPYDERDPYVFDGPWIYFWGKDQELDGGIIILDEVHNFCGKRHSKEVQNRWYKFIGELGHKKCMLRCITQNYAALGSGITEQQASRYCIANTSLRRIPFFKFSIYEIQMLLKAFFRVPYYQPIVLEEQRTDVFNNRKVQVENTFSTVMVPEIFNLYDSFNKPIEGSQEKDENKKPFMDDCDQYIHDYGPVKGRINLLIDFIRRNFFRLSIFGPCLLALILAPFYISDVVAWTAELGEKLAQEMTSKLGKQSPPPKQEDKIVLPEDKPIVDSPLPLPTQAEQSIAPSRYVDNEVVRRKVIAPKICFISPDFLAYDDGMIVWKGDSFLDSELVAIDYRAKKAILKNGKKVSIVFSNYLDDGDNGVSRQAPARPKAQGKN